MMGNVNRRDTVDVMDSNQKPAIQPWQSTSSHFSSLCESVVSVLREFKEYTVGAVAVTLHQALDSSPKKLLVLGVVTNQRRKSIQRRSLSIRGFRELRLRRLLTGSLGTLRISQRVS